MPLPEIFAHGDPSEAKLAGYFEEMYDYLVEEGVPEDRLPGPWHMLSRLVKCLDPELFREWLDAYIAVEAEDGDEDEEETPRLLSEEAPRQRRRPNYLRAIDPDLFEETPEDSDES